MGVGGLLKEIEPAAAAREGAAHAAQPAPRRAARPRIAAVVLAAGRSRRMAPHNKLLVADRTGKPMIARVVDNVLSSGARPVLVVLGHQAERGGAGAGRAAGALRARAPTMPRACRPA